MGSVYSATELNINTAGLIIAWPIDFPVAWIEARI